MELHAFVQALQPYLVQQRRALHRRPELSHKEFVTTEYILSELAALGIPAETGPEGTGVIARLRGTQDGPVTAFRADIDALPVTEETGLPFASENARCMHACGHDFHAAILLGLAKALSGGTIPFRGEVVFLFQPAEECFPGGAAPMMHSGLLDDVDFFYGMHIQPQLKSGQFNVAPGAVMANPTRFAITVNGKGGHGACPQQAHDPIVCACQLVQSLQTVVAREVNPLSAAVVSVCTFNSVGEADNVIPSAVRLAGTIRVFQDGEQKRITQAMTRIAQATCEAHEMSCELFFERGYPVVVNDEAEAAKLRTAGERSQLIWQPLAPSMVGEDFAYYLQGHRGAYGFLGVGSGREDQPPLHSAHLAPDESALAGGVELFLRLLTERC